MILSPPRRLSWAIAGLVFIGVAISPLVVHAQGARAGVTKGVRPDIVLSPDHRAAERHVNSVLVNDLSPLAHDEAEDVNPASPDQCRDIPAFDLLCDVYRIRIVRDPAPGAANFVQILLSWPRQASTPALPLAAAGIGQADLPDIDVFLYSNPDSPEDYAKVGGRGSITPERVVFEATQEEYDLVVRSGTGVTTEYTLKARVTNELPFTPYEYLETSPTPPSASAPPAGPDSTVASGGSVAIPASLTLAPLDADAQIGGIGLGTTEQFDPALVGRSAARQAAADVAAPAVWMLWFALLVTPAAVLTTGYIVMRRRHGEVF